MIIHYAWRFIYLHFRGITVIPTIFGASTDLKHIRNNVRIHEVELLKIVRHFIKFFFILSLIYLQSVLHHWSTRYQKHTIIMNISMETYIWMASKSTKKLSRTLRLYNFYISVHNLKFKINFQCKKLKNRFPLINQILTIYVAMSKSKGEFRVCIILCAIYKKTSYNQ